MTLLTEIRERVEPGKAILIDHKTTQELVEWCKALLEMIERKDAEIVRAKEWAKNMFCGCFMEECNMAFEAAWKEKVEAIGREGEGV